MGRKPPEDVIVPLSGTLFLASKTSVYSVTGLQVYLNRFLLYPSLFQPCLYPAALPWCLQADSLLSYPTHSLWVHCSHFILSYFGLSTLLFLKVNNH